MYTLLWSVPALIVFFSVYGLVSNVRSLKVELQHESFPTKRLLLCALCLATMSIGFVGVVWVLNLIIHRNT